MRATSFIAFAICLVLALVVVDPGVSHAMLSAPFAAMLIGTTFAIDPLDRVMTLAEWRTLRRISASTERRMRKAGLGPRLINISAGQLGVRVRDDIAWMEAGGASGESVPNANAPIARRNTGRDTRAATAASVVARQRKAGAATIAAPGSRPAAGHLGEGGKDAPAPTTTSPAEQHLQQEPAE